MVQKVLFFYVVGLFFYLPLCFSSNIGSYPDQCGTIGENYTVINYKLYGFCGNATVKIGIVKQKIDNNIQNFGVIICRPQTQLKTRDQNKVIKNLYVNFVLKTRFIQDQPTQNIFDIDTKSIFPRYEDRGKSMRVIASGKDLIVKTFDTVSGEKLISVNKEDDKNITRNREFCEISIANIGINFGAPNIQLSGGGGKIIDVNGKPVPDSRLPNMFPGSWIMSQSRDSLEKSKDEPGQGY